MEPMMILMKLDALGYEVIGGLGSLLWQSTLLILAGALVTMLLQRKSSATRASVWVFVLCTIPLLPILGVLADRVDTPRTEIPVLPAYEQPAFAATPAPAPLMDAPVPVFPDRMLEGAINLFDTPWALLFMAYLTGAVVMCALTAFGWIRLGAWARSGRVLTDSRTNGIITAMRNRLGLARGVVAVEHPNPTVPLQLGVSRHVLLFPAGMSEGLADEELRAVVTHELAHARRQDALVLAVASLIRAVLWFHPLVWLAARRVAVLAERACDELVLAAGSDPAGYAELLAGQACRLKRRFTPELAAGFVFSRHAFLARIEAILSHRPGGFARMSKRALAGTAVALLIALVLSVSVPLGVVPARVAPVLIGSESLAQVSQRTATFRARCIESITGEPVQGVRLNIQDAGLPAGISDADGLVEIADTPIDTVKVNVLSDAYPRWWTRQGTMKHQHIIRLTSLKSYSYLEFNVTADMSPVTITVERGVTIRGTVLDPDGTPVSGASVTAGSGNGNSLSGDKRFDVVTDARGRYEIHPPASNEESYYLLAHDGGLNEWRTWANGVTELFSTRPGDVIENKTIQLTRPAVVTGRVLGPDGTPIPGFTVRACAGDNYYYDPLVKTDRNGSYRIAHIAPGKQVIFAGEFFYQYYGHNYLDESVGALPTGMFKMVHVDAGEELSGIDLVGWSQDEVRRHMNE